MGGAFFSFGYSIVVDNSNQYSVELAPVYKEVNGKAKYELRTIAYGSDVGFSNIEFMVTPQVAKPTEIKTDATVTVRWAPAASDDEVTQS